MTALQVYLGLVTTAVVVGAAASTGASVCAVLVPEWRGADRLLARSTVAVAAVLLEAHVLGAVGLFRRGWLLSAALAIALAAHALARRRAPRLGTSTSTTGAGTPVSPLALVTAGVVCIVGGQWMARVASAYHDGITDIDSLQYHLPHAARYAETGWITPLHFVSFFTPENTFHPSDTELLHGIGMALTGRDVLSPLLNIAFAGLLLLAAWCVGGGSDAGRVAVIGTAAVLAMPVTALSAGSAASDVPAMAFLVAAVAFAMRGRNSRAALLLSSVAAGLAIGMKLTVAAPVAALVIGALVLSRGSGAARTRGVCVLAFVVTGSFWYARNLVAVGNPVPGLQLGPLVRVPGAEVDAFSVIHYVGDASAWQSWLLPGLATGSNPLWWLLAIVALAAVAALALARDRWSRLCALVIVAGFAAYVVTPNTAAGPDGFPWQFALNLRYVFPSVVLALALLPRSIAEHRPRVLAIVTSLYVILFIASEVAGRTNLPGLRVGVPAWPSSYRALGVAVAVVAFVLWLARRRVTTPRPARIASVVAGLLLVVIAPAVVAQYFDTRYRDQAPWSAADDLQHARVAVAGTAVQYPFYGRDLSNTVQFIGRRVAHGGYEPFASCRTWAEELRRGRYDAVAVLDDTAEARWISELDGTMTARTGNLALYRVDASATTPEQCNRDAAGQ